MTKKKGTNVREQTAFKQIELESPGCSGFEENFQSFPTVI